MAPAARLDCQGRENPGLRWVGIDEAGYGPNLGPLVMTAVTAEAADDVRMPEPPVRKLDLWGDLASTVDRAGGDPSLLWVDDSKAILRGGKGRDRLEATCLATLHAAGIVVPGSLPELLAAIQAGTPDEAELSPWFGGPSGPTEWPWIARPGAVDALLNRRALQPAGGAWRLIAIETVIIGPAQFNAGLAVSGTKADVHFAAFARLLLRAWNRAVDGRATAVTGDKHGGRHYYLVPLSGAFPDTWIDRGPERPESSQYTIRDPNRRLELTLVPKADRTDGLVALASIVSKAVREIWMDGFNAYWCARVPGLRPTAGYPVDARRFRRAIEPVAAAEGCDPSRWWRTK
jgi:hypothetical protein